MCTVTYFNSNGRIIITSNRDEHTLRPGAIEPKSYLIGGKKIFFPKDPKAGGTWYAVKEDATVLVLLNGAEERHQLKPAYRKSRGLILLELISSESIIQEWDNIDLKDIEPFTLVVFEQNRLYQLRWDENNKSSIELDTSKGHIWSSATLYPKAVREKRKDWFRNFLNSESEIDEESLFGFHRYTENENSENGLVINRNDKLKTLSITQTVIENNKFSIRYSDLIAEAEYSNSFISI